MYIEREKARKAFNLWFGGVSHAVIANKILDEVPAADVAPVVHGEWEPYGMNPNGVVGNWHCSVCNGTSLEDSNYCPNCGAKMDA